MPFLLLLLLMLACFPVAWPVPPSWIGAWESIYLTWLGVVLVIGLALFISQWTRYQAQRGSRARAVLAQRHGTWRFYHMISLFVIYGLALYVLGWGWVVQNACLVGPPGREGLDQLLPGTELFILAPFLAALILSWACFYDAERALHEMSLTPGEATPFWSRSAYIGFHVRQNLALVFAPIALLIAATSVFRLWPYSQDSKLFQALPVALVAGVFVCMPLVLRLVLGLRPLAPGPLRDRLLAAAGRLNFRFSDVVLWNTHGGVANAMVAGILPQIRYVILTDRLVAELTPAEIEAVFGHEVGHVKHRHMLYYLGFFLASLTVVTELWSTTNLEVLLNLTKRQDLAVLPHIALVGTYIFVVFGFLSRRCERQADIFGCRAVSCDRSDCFGHDGTVALVPGGRGLCPTGIHTFIDALEKVALLNGISRDRPGWLQSWQHSTIARRVEFLQRILNDPKLEPRFQRAVGFVKWTLLIVLFALLVALFGPQLQNVIGGLLRMPNVY